MIAARIHGFRRSQKEVGRVVKICEATLRKRVLEFIATPSSAQTVAEFHGSADDFATAMNPPCFQHPDSFSATSDEFALPADLGKAIDDEMHEALKSSELRELETEFTKAAPATPPPPSASGGTPAMRMEEDKEEKIVEESLSDSESDDEEVGRMVLSVEESECKEKIWMEMNEEYFREQEIKRKWEEDQIAMGIKPDSVRKKRRKKNVFVPFFLLF